MKDLNPDLFIPLTKACERYEWYDQEFDEKLMKNINVKQQDDLYLYNYNDFVLVDRNHPVLRRCRGLVLDSDGFIVAYPMDRFFNTFEKEAAVLDWNRAQALEKIDGSMISLFYHRGKWHITTRGSFYDESETVDNFSYLFLQHFHNFDKLWKDCTYVFELVTHYNRIVTHYDEEFVALITIRNNTTPFHEFPQYTLDHIADILQVRRPKRTQIFQKKDMEKLFTTLKPDDEGFVVIDPEFNRVKMKQESYIKMAKIKALKDEDIWDYVMKRVTAFDFKYDELWWNGDNEIKKEERMPVDQILKQFPEVQEKIMYMMYVHNHVLSEAQATFEKKKHFTNRKDFALSIQYIPYKAWLFAMYDHKFDKLYEKVKWSQVEKIAKEMGLIE